MYRSSPRPRSLSQVRSGLWSVCVRTFPVKWDSLVVVIGGGSGKGPLSPSGVPSSPPRSPIGGGRLPFLSAVGLLLHISRACWGEGGGRPVLPAGTRLVP